MGNTQPTAPTTPAVADELLAEFDRLAGDGDTLPVDTIKDRYATSRYFRYRDHEIYDTVLELPVTVHMLISGSTDPVVRIVKALKEIHGDTLLIDLDNDAHAVKLRVRTWKPETVLRGLWKQFAEAEYKTNLKAA